ncbi:hypothetical protein MMC25_002703 [Agyrium rufum]|nr:hypothetical protein [Agyrium rufum]
MSLLRKIAGIVLLWSSFTESSPVFIPKIEWVQCARNVPVPATNFNVTGVNLRALPSTLHCGRLVVPIDYSYPISASNNITLGLAMYRPQNPKGVLFFCPGGTDPGVAAIWQMALNQTGPFMPDFSGLQMYDVMAMDIRGTWTSNQLNVNTSIDAFPTVLGAIPTNEAQFEAIKIASSQLIESFVQTTQPSALVQHTGTVEVVQDYENIRKALGYELIHFLGVSYGSYRAAQYAAAYPRRVGNFVLDAIAPHGLSLFDQANYEIIAANRGLLRSDTYCQNDVDCKLRTKGIGSIPMAYDEVLARLQNSTALHPSAFQQALVGALGGQSLFPVINELLYDLINGDDSALTGAGSGGINVESVLGIIYLCSDNTFPITWEAFEQALKASEKIDTYHTGQPAAWLTILACSAWKYSKAPLRSLVLDKPMLYVTADFDVSTPTEKATWMWKHHGKGNSALVVRHGDDHVSWNLPSAASTEITKEFLRTGIMPKARSDKLVTIYEPGTQRGPIPDPYSVITGYIAGDCVDPDTCNLV